MDPFSASSPPVPKPAFQPAAEQPSVALVQVPTQSPWKGVMLSIFFLVSIAVSGVGGYFLGAEKTQDEGEMMSAVILSPTLSPSPTEVPPGPVSTSYDNAYVNNKYGYSFSYPGSMEVKICSPEFVYPVPKSGKADPCQSGAGTQGFISVQKWSADAFPDMKSYDVVRETMQIGEKPAIHITGSRKSTAPAPIPDMIEYIVLEHNGIRLWVDALTIDKGVLSTFRFIK